MNYQSHIRNVIKQIWMFDIKKAYRDSNLINEDTLKATFFMFLHNRLGKTFLKENDLKIFTEYPIKIQGENKKIDLVVAHVDQDKASRWEGPIVNTVKSIVVAIEFKYKHNDKALFSDMQKIIKYVDEIEHNSYFYYAFIEEEGVRAEDPVKGWVNEEEQLLFLNKVTGIYSYWNESSVDQWKVKVY